jgi:hypothetical protein
MLRANLTSFNLRQKKDAIANKRSPVFGIAELRSTQPIPADCLANAVRRTKKQASHWISFNRLSKRSLC